MKNSVSKEKMIREALSRMKMLKLSPMAIDEFSMEGMPNLSSNGFCIRLNDMQHEKVRDFENENDCLVYHVIHSRTSLGDMLILLYVSSYINEWKQERSDLKAGFPLAYAINLDNDILSEFGTVGIKQRNGGLIRTI